MHKTLTQEIKDLYDMKFKVWKKIPGRWEDHTHTWISRVNKIRMAINPNKIPTQFFTDFDRKTFSFMRKQEKPRIVKSILKNTRAAGCVTTPERLEYFSLRLMI